jgi:hypothetical protein
MSVDKMRMPEAEVSLRLAFWLLDNHVATGLVEVALDGAQVQVGDVVHFEIDDFMGSSGWHKCAMGAAWQCDWRKSATSANIRIHSNPGRGDVVARLKSGHTLRVECKKGSLERSKSSSEYPLLREALGQLCTVAEVNNGDVLGVAVPHSRKFQELAERWRRAPLISRLGILILTVDRSGEVFGFPERAA